MIRKAILLFMVLAIFATGCAKNLTAVSSLNELSTKGETTLKDEPAQNAIPGKLALTDAAGVAAPANIYIVPVGLD